jgi:probable phosphoglycerate mutase
MTDRADVAPRRPGSLSSPRMELLLVRHALPVRIDGGDGPADPGLSEAGHRQAAALGEWLADEGVDAIWSSPMRRARETAAPLADRLGLEVHVDDDLKEFDADQDHYIPMEELDSDDPRWRELIERLGAPEQYAFRDRAADAVERVVVAHPGQRVAVVCHGGVVNAYLSRILGIERPLFFEPTYTSISRVMASSRGHRSLVSINEIPHLPHLRRELRR